MRQRLSSRSRLVWPALLLALLPAALAGQTREVVSNQLAISQSEATLHLEFDDGGMLEISFHDGTVRVDDRAIGSFDPGDDLDTAWRTLLGEIVTLSDGPLGRALQEWAPPASLSRTALDVARGVDEALEDALRTGQPVDEDAQESDGVVSIDVGLGLRALLSRTEMFGELREALEGVDVLGSAIHIGEDVLVAEGEVIDGTLVVVDADLTVEGTVDGDVVVVQGSVRVVEGSRILGNVRLVDSRYVAEDGASVSGRVIRVEVDDADPVILDSEEIDDIRNRLRSEIRSELRREFREDRNVARGFSPFAAIARGVAGVMENLMTFAILSLMALGLVYFAKDNLEMVADTARRNPWRAGLVGLAGAFLVLPTWLLGCVALVVSVVGIIALPFWALLFPVAVAVGAGLGYLAVARNVGEWVAAKNISGLEWIRPTNTFYAIVTGVGALMAFSVASSIVDIAPFLGFIAGLLAALGSMATMAALLVGFGAVLLTRGGRQSEFYDGHDPFDEEPMWSDESELDEVLEADMEAEKVETVETVEATADVAEDASEGAPETGESNDDE